MWCIGTLSEEYRERMYGLLERQFRRYFSIAQKRKGVTGQLLLQRLERRLDNVMFRLGFTASRAEGRQLVQHRAVVVNGKRVDIPSFAVRAGDVVQVAPGPEGWAARIKHTLETNKDRSVPAWLHVEPQQLTGRIVRLPEKDDMDLALQEQLIVELYSK